MDDKGFAAREIVYVGPRVRERGIYSVRAARRVWDASTVGGSSISRGFGGAATERTYDELALALGMTIRAVRLRQGLTIRDVAARSGGHLGVSALGAYERGERELSVRRFCLVASCLRVEPPALLAKGLGQMPGSERASADEVTLIPEDDDTLSVRTHDLEVTSGPGARQQAPAPGS